MLPLLQKPNEPLPGNVALMAFRTAREQQVELKEATEEASRREREAEAQRERALNLSEGSLNTDPNPTNSVEQNTISEGGDNDSVTASPDSAVSNGRGVGVNVDLFA